MIPTAFVKEISSTPEYAVRLITSVDETGELFYAYLLIESQRVAALEASLRERAVDLTEFGLVLATGKGVVPDEATKREVERKILAAQNLDS